jgi:PTH1 family peptidyl-tRNA hydrolase
VARKRRPGRGSSKRQQGVPFLGDLGPGDNPVMVVGLGNPGRRYSSTRHNAGLMAADSLMEGATARASGRWTGGEISLLEAATGRFLVLKPSTFMNDSGRAVAPVLKRYGIDPLRLAVIHDDIDIPLGEIRVKRGGGTGGHRGLASLVEEIGSNDFIRVRVGVGRPPEGVDPAQYVLTGFSREEREQARDSVDRAARATLDLVTGAEGGRV